MNDKLMVNPQTNFTTVTHECECCGEDIEVDYSKLKSSNERVRCPHCNALYGVDVDAELIDGAWKDRTKLCLLDTKQHPEQDIRQLSTLELHIGSALTYLDAGNEDAARKHLDKAMRLAEAARRIIGPNSKWAAEL